MRNKFLSTALLGLALMLGSANAQVVVRMGPPPPPRLVVVPRPGPGFVWQPGFYRWNGRSYIWAPGVWTRPPRPEFHHWTPGHWRQTPGGWVWVDGHWRR